MKVFLDDAYLNTGIHQHLRKIQGNGAAADDQGILYRMRFQTDLAEEFFLLLDRCDDGNDIAGVKDRIALRDLHLAVTLQCADQDIAVKLLVHRQKVSAIQDRSLRNSEMKKLHPALGKGVDLNRRRESQNPRDLLCGRKLLVDDQGQAKFLFNKIDCLVVLRIMDPGNGLAVACLSGQQAGEKIQFILPGYSNYEVRMCDVCFLQNGIVRSVAAKTHYVKPVTNQIDDFRIRVDDRDIVTFPAQIMC